MNDFDYDCLQKKRLARNAFARKGTVNRKGCRLPHENLTKKELNELNGEVFTINTLEKVSWERFKTLPVGLQTEYLQALLDRFGVGLNPIGTDLFGLADCSLANYVHRRGIKLKLKTGGRISNAAKASWLRWINSDPIFAPVSEVPEAVDVPEEDYLPNTGTVNKIRAPQKPDEETTPLLRAHDINFNDLFREAGLERVETNTHDGDEPEEKSIPYPLNDMRLTLEGTPIDILAALRMSFPALLDKDAAYRFTISVEKRRDEWRPDHL